MKELVESASQLSKKELDSARAAADAVVERLRRGRRLDKGLPVCRFLFGCNVDFCLDAMLKVIVHIDMDMFYAAVEMRDQPSLKEKPMAVGTTAMLTTSNYKVIFRNYFTDFPL